jgi:hypothetical protein
MRSTDFACASLASIIGGMLQCSAYSSGADHYRQQPYQPVRHIAIIREQVQKRLQSGDSSASTGGSGRC